MWSYGKIIWLTSYTIQVEKRWLFKFVTSQKVVWKFKNNWVFHILATYIHVSSLLSMILDEMASSHIWTMMVLAKVNMVIWQNGKKEAVDLVQIFDGGHCG